jgi:hypothetical protein
LVLHFFGNIINNDSRTWRLFTITKQYSH